MPEKEKKNQHILSMGLEINADDKIYLDKYFEFVRKMQNYFISYQLKKYNKMVRETNYQELKIQIDNIDKAISNFNRQIINRQKVIDEGEISKCEITSYKNVIAELKKDISSLKKEKSKYQKQIYELLKEYRFSDLSFKSDVAIFDKIDYFTKPCYKTKNGKLARDKNGNKIPILDEKGRVKSFYETPDPDNPDKIIKSKLRWRFSKHYRKLSQRKAYLEGINARKRKLYDENLVNELLPYFNEINIQKNDFKRTQMSKQKVGDSTDEKKKAGLHIKEASPSQFVEILKRKVISHGGKVNIITKKECQATEFNHTDGKFYDMPVSNRWFGMSDGNVLQRDAHTAFNLLTLNDIEKSNKLYDDFLKQHSAELEKFNIVAPEQVNMVTCSQAKEKRKSARKTKKKNIA